MRPKKFKKNPYLLNEMLTLRRRGWTYVSLAFIYNVDHSSIYSWCKIWNVPMPTDTLSINITELVSHFGYEAPKEKSYKDYLELERKRRNPNLHRVLGRI